jgi:hypothetical protein
MAGPLTTLAGLTAAANISNAFRAQGDSLLAADRKNKMERQRLERVLKALARERAREEFSIERQKRTIATKWKTVTKTTGMKG